MLLITRGGVTNVGCFELGGGAFQRPTSVVRISIKGHSLATYARNSRADRMMQHLPETFLRIVSSNVRAMKDLRNWRALSIVKKSVEVDDVDFRLRIYFLQERRKESRVSCMAEAEQVVVNGPRGKPVAGRLCGEGELHSTAADKQYIRIGGKVDNFGLEAIPKGAVIIISVFRRVAIGQIAAFGVAIRRTGEYTLRPQFVRISSDNKKNENHNIGQRFNRKSAGLRLVLENIRIHTRFTGPRSTGTRLGGRLELPLQSVNSPIWRKSIYLEYCIYKRGNRRALS